MADSTAAFFTAFGLETLLFSSELWAKLPVGVVLAMMVILISWCIWTTLEAGGDISFLGWAHALKGVLAGFIRRLQGKATESGPDEGNGGDRDRQGKSRALKEVFNRLRPPRGHRFSTSSTLVNAGRCGPLHTTEVEMSEVDPKGPRSDVSAV